MLVKKCLFCEQILYPDTSKIPRRQLSGWSNSLQELVEFPGDLGLRNGRLRILQLDDFDLLDLLDAAWQKKDDSNVWIGYALMLVLDSWC